MRFCPQMLISEALIAHPDAPLVFERHGLACAACLAAEMETLVAVANMHDIDLGELLGDLNTLPEEPR